MNFRTPADPNTCKHPDEALKYNSGTYAPSIVNGVQGQPGMFCQACHSVVTPVNNRLDFVDQRKLKYLAENHVLRLPVLDPFGKPIKVGSLVAFPKPKTTLGWGIVEDINHGKPVTPEQMVQRPRVTAPDRLKVRPTDHNFNQYSWDIRNDGERKSYGLGLKVAPWAVVVG